MHKNSEDIIVPEIVVFSFYFTSEQKESFYVQLEIYHMYCISVGSVLTILNQYSSVQRKKSLFLLAQPMNAFPALLHAWN